MTIVNRSIDVKGLTIRAKLSSKGDDYISLTDIAKYEDEDNPRYIIQNWMRNRSTVDYLAIWEELHNPNFNRVEFEAVTKNAGRNAFVMTPQKWIDSTNAIGIISKSGRYGGTYAHSDSRYSFVSILLAIQASMKLYAAALASV